MTKRPETLAAVADRLVALRSALNPREHAFVWDAMTLLADDIRRLTPQWQPIGTAPPGKRVLVRTLIEGHRLVIGFLTKEGLWLDERMQPMPFPPQEWQELPT